MNLLGSHGMHTTVRGRASQACNDIFMYLDGQSEKPARSAYFAAIVRQLGADKLLILDGMNYIKGFRYQIYCAAREAGVRVCTVSRAHRLGCALRQRSSLPGSRGCYSIAVRGVESFK